MKKSNNKNNKILLVDDEPDITSCFMTGLEDSGFIVDAFNDPLLALETLKRKVKGGSSSYALAVLDIKMPKMNGLELFNQIRNLNNRIRICFVTAFDLQKEMKDLNVVVMPSSSNEKPPAVIQKPISINDFVATVKTEISLQKQSQQIRFLICESCFWCASLLYQIPDNTTILNWHTCENKTICSYALA
jgi:DNA-binding response OmpR family regulator